MIKVTPIAVNKNSIPFEKNRKEIIKDAPNRELRRIAKDLMGVYGDEFALDVGVPSLLKYAEKGEVEKKQAVSMLKDAIDSEELRTDHWRCMFFGIPYFEDDHTDNEGYIGAYEKLTGIKLDIKI